MNTKKIVCLGGGIGTVNLIKGIKKYHDDITVVLSMADDGGSSGRLRRLYKMLPPGDLVSCMAALAKDPSGLSERLLRYRFPGNRYGRDNELAGQRLGGLIMVAMRDITGSFTGAIELFKKTFDIEGDFLPATDHPITVSAKTIEGKMIRGEEKIDRGLYRGKRVLQKVFLSPKKVVATVHVKKALDAADVIIAGPGDLYTTILPTLLVPGVAEAIKKSRANKIFIVNVANKPFETRGYTVSQYIQAITVHLGFFPFNSVVINNNYEVPIPKKYRYGYVYDRNNLHPKVKVITEDLINEDFPLYHSPEKLARSIKNYI